MKTLPIYLVALCLFGVVPVLGELSSLKETQEASPPEVSILIADPAEGAVVAIDRSGVFRTLKVGDRLKSEKWNVELVHVTAEQARFEGTWSGRVGGSQSLEIWLAARRPDEQHSRVRIVDSGQESPKPATLGPPPVVVGAVKPEDARVYRISATEGNVEVSDDLDSGL